MATTVEEYRTYHADRGNDEPTQATTAAATASLLRATDYITYHYLTRITADVPVDLVDRAIYEAAALELATPGFWTKTYTPDQQKVLTKVGEIQWTLRESKGGAEAATPVSTKIEGMLRPYIMHYFGVRTV